MKSWFLVFVCFACPLLAQQEEALRATGGTALEQGSIGLKLVRGNMMIMNAAGQQEPLTMGSFVQYSVDAIIKGKSCNVKVSEPVFVGYEWNKKKTLEAYIATVDVKKYLFTLSNFLNVLADSLDRCKEWDKKANPQPANTAAIMMEKGNTMLVDLKGKKQKLNLGNLISIASIAFKDCSPGAVRDRVVQVFIDTTDREKIRVYQVDAYGQKEDFTFDNLATAAADTLGSCPKDAAKPFAKMQPNSIKIQFDKSSEGELQTYLITSQGKKAALDLGILLVAAAQMVPYYEGKNDMLVITYAKDPNGAVSATLTDLNGRKMDLTLDNLVKSAATFYSF